MRKCRNCDELIESSKRVTKVYCSDECRWATNSGKRNYHQDGQLVTLSDEDQLIYESAMDLSDEFDRVESLGYIGNAHHERMTSPRGRFLEMKGKSVLWAQSLRLQNPS